MIEPILDESNIKYPLFPIRYHTLWNQYKTQQKAIWTAEEIDFSKDLKEFKTLTPEIQHVIKMILAFFSNMDGIVNLNIDKNLISKITINEAITAYRFQAMMEGIHNECYSLMIDNLITDHDEKNYLFESIKTIKSISNISNWALKWIQSDSPISYKIVAFACVEGILFSGAFAIIYWLKFKINVKMDGLIKSNELISRDEKLHCDFACELYKLLNNKLSEKEIYIIVDECVKITKEFNNETLQSKLIGINNSLMNQYSEYVADRLIVQLGYNKKYKVSNPFQFLQTIGMVQKTNFHESRPTEYQKTGFSQTANENNKIYYHDDF